MLLENINRLIATNCSTYESNDISNLLSEPWSCQLTVEDKVRALFVFDNRFRIVWLKNHIEYWFEQKFLGKSPNISAINNQPVTLSFALVEGFIRIQNSGINNGTFKIPSVPSFTCSQLLFKSGLITSVGEVKMFPKEEALKNIAGLELWLKPERLNDTCKVTLLNDLSYNDVDFSQTVENAPTYDISSEALYFEHGQSLIYSGSHYKWLFTEPSDVLVFFVLEPHEYKPPVLEQTLFDISYGNNQMKYSLCRVDEEHGSYIERESITKLHIKHKVSIGGKTYETTSFIDMLFVNWFVKNETPGPLIYFLSSRTIKDDKVITRNYNYNKKWFNLEQLQHDIAIASEIPNEPVKITLGSSFHGKIKELFIYGRKMNGDNLFDDTFIKWIMAYLKSKYAITDSLFQLE